MIPIRKYFYLLLSSLFLSYTSSFGQNVKDSIDQGTKVLTLEQVIASLENNPSLLTFDEKINSNNAYARGARSLEPPKITAGLWMFPYSIPQKNTSDMPAENQGSLMIGVEQMVMNPGKRKAEQRYMEGMSSLEETMKSYDRQNMIEEAKKMYYEWLILKKKQSVLKESENLMNLMIKSGEIGYTYNQNQLPRIYKARSELYTLQNMQIMIENEIRQMNIGLNTMMNIDKSVVFDIDTNYTIAAYDVMPIDTNLIKSRRSDLKNIEESVKLIELKKIVEQSKRKPDFGIQYAHMNSFGSMPNQFNLMGMLTIPIVPWASKGYKANLEGLKYETKSLQLRKNAIMNEAVGKLENLRYDIGNKKRQVKMYQQNLLPALEKNFNTSLIAYEHMKEDLFMTIDAWMALKMAKIEYLDLLGGLLKLQASYEREIEGK